MLFGCIDTVATVVFGGLQYTVFGGLQYTVFGKQDWWVFDF